MKHKIYYLITFFSLILQTSNYLAKGDRALIENTCKATPSYNLCLSTLLSNPKSSSADISGLGLILVSATKTMVTQTMHKIRVLYGSHPEMRHVLGECHEAYNAVLVADVPEAVEALTKGDPKFAENGMADVAVEALGCESGFGGHGGPLTGMNKAVHDLSVVARAIIRNLL